MTIMTKCFRDLYWHVMSPEARQGCVHAAIWPRVKEDKIVYDLTAPDRMEGLDLFELIEELEAIGTEIFKACRILHEEGRI